MTDADLPPSSIHVRHILEDLGGEATRQELLEETELPERTVDDALTKLEQNDEISRDRYESDLRETVCSIRV